MPKKKSACEHFESKEVAFNPLKIKLKMKIQPVPFVENGTVKYKQILTRSIFQTKIIRRKKFSGAQKTKYYGTYYFFIQTNFESDRWIGR